MARVNLEEQLFGEMRLSRLAALANISVCEAVGKLVFLWHESQEQLKFIASKREIASWCFEQDTSRFVDLLADCNYIHEVKTGLYEIHGNLIQIKSRLAKIRPGMKGSSEIQEKWNNSSKVQLAQRGNFPILQDNLQGNLQGNLQDNLQRIRPGYPIQFNSIQDKTGQDNNTLLSESAERETQNLPNRVGKKNRIITWTPEDDLAEVFSNLCSCPKYAAIFDREKDRKTLYETMAKYSLTLTDLVQISWEFKNWSDGPAGQKMKSPRGTLATFCRNHKERKDAQPKRRPDARSLPQHMPIEDSDLPEEKLCHSS